MSYVEGIGDELLVVIAVFILMVIVCLVWLSTSVIEPRISVIVVDAQRFQDLLNRVRDAGFRIININRVVNNSEGNNTPRVEDRGNSDENDGDVPSENNEPGSSVENVDNSSSVDDKRNDKIQDNEAQKQSGIEDIIDNQATSTRNAQNDNLKENDVSIPRTPSNSSPCDSSSSIFSPSNCDIHANVESTSDNKEEPVVHIKSTKVSSLPEAQNEGGNLSQTADVQTESRDDTPSAGHIRIRLKYLDDRQKLVQALPEQTVGEFKRSHFAGELAENLMVRLIYNGQELRPDTKPLQAYNIQDSSVVHCLLSQNTREETNSVHNEEEDFNIGTYIFPLFGVILGLIWYSRFSYGRYFNAISTLSLVGITFMYIIALLATFRTRDGDAEVHEHED